MSNSRGKLIVFEGLDGCGSTTQAELLKRWLEDRNQPVYYTKEPTEGPFGFMIRLFLAKRVGVMRGADRFERLDDQALALAFAADRMDHIHNEIGPKMQAGITVVADRYYLSSLAYQAISVEYDWLKAINAKCTRPDVTIFLDVPPLVCKKRMERQRWHVELYEEIPMLERVQQNYYSAIKDLVQRGERIEIVNGNRPIADVQKEVISLLKSVLKTSGVPRNQLSLSELLDQDKQPSSEG